MFEIHGIESRSPKNVMREMRNIDIFSVEETILAIEMIEDRNCVSNTYNEEQTSKVANKVSKYAAFMAATVKRIDSLG